MTDTASESQVQSLVRMEAARKACRLFRNNVGVLKDLTGRPVRYGLANDSAELNRVLKSADLVGWRVVTITPDMVGRKIAQVVTRECKPEDWRPALSGERFEREEAQRRWAALVNADGGDAQFATGEGTL